MVITDRISVLLSKTAREDPTCSRNTI